MKSESYRTGDIVVVEAIDSTAAERADLKKRLANEFPDLRILVHDPTRVQLTILRRED